MLKSLLRVSKDSRAIRIYGFSTKQVTRSMNSTVKLTQFNSNHKSNQRQSTKSLLAAGIAAVTLAIATSQQQTECEKRKKNYDKTDGIKIFCGTVNEQLAKDIAKELDLSICKMKVSRFSDGEVGVEIQDNVRGKDVYIIQSICPPINESLMELLLVISTMKRSSANTITAIIPYFGYARQNSIHYRVRSIAASEVARMLESMGVDRVVAVDLHRGQIQGFFERACDDVDGSQVALDYFGKKDLENPVIVSPDVGGVYRAKKFRERLFKDYQIDGKLAVIVKRKASNHEEEKLNIVGEVNGCDAIIVDDLVDTADTITDAAKVLKAEGAKNIYAFTSHGIFTGPAIRRILVSPIDELLILDTVPLSDAVKATGKVKQLPVAPLLAQIIYNIHNKKSIHTEFSRVTFDSKENFRRDKDRLGKLRKAKDS